MRTPLFSLIALLVLPSIVLGQPLADRLPSDAVIYAGWRGADSMGPGYETSHLKAVLDASDFAQLINEFLPQVIKRIGKEDPEAAQILPIISAVAKPMWKHPSALYVGAMGVEGGEPSPRLALLCDAGADAPALLATLKDLLVKAEGLPVPIAVRETKGLVIITVGKMSLAFDALTGIAAAGEAPSLANDKAFKESMTHVVADPTVAFYVNVEGIVSNANELVNQFGEAKDKEMWAKIRDGLGLAGLKRVTIAAGFDGKDWMESAFVAAPAPRIGLLKMLDGGALSGDALKVVPKTSTHVSAGRFNLAGFIGQVRDGVTQFDPAVRDQVDGAIQQVNQMTGMEVQKDLLGVFGSEWVGYIDPNIGGFSLAGAVLVNHLTDAAKAEQSLSKMEQFINQLIVANFHEEGMTIEIQKRKIGDLTVHYLAIPIVTPAWAIQDGNWYAALLPQTVVGAAKFVAAKSPSILENPDFLAVLKRLGAESAGSVQYTDLVRLAPVNYGSWVFVSRLVGFGDLFGIPSPLIVLPPMAPLMANLSSAADVTWSDDSGFYYKGVSPFPGSTILGTNPVSTYMSASPALTLGILLPSLSKARVTANRVKSGSNLRQIGQGCYLHANENNGAFPPDLGSLLKQELTPVVFISPLGNQQVPQEKLTPEQLAVWVNEHSDYVYLGKGQKNDLKPDKLLAYEKLENGGNEGVNMLFGDGHVEFVLMPQAVKFIEENAPKP